jgi:hypothetical protein
MRCAFGPSKVQSDWFDVSVSEVGNCITAPSLHPSVYFNLHIFNFYSKSYEGNVYKIHLCFSLKELDRDLRVKS